MLRATIQDVFGLVNKGTFREDLYYRLKVFPIIVPPLRVRKKDIAVLIGHFIDNCNKKTGKLISGVNQEAMRIMLDYNWPGNVRELENAIEHAFVLCSDKYIDIFDLPVEIRQMEYRPQSNGYSYNSANQMYSNQKLTRDSLVEVLQNSNWNKAEVARRVGLSRASIWKYMKKWDIPLKNEK